MRRIEMLKIVVNKEIYVNRGDLVKYLILPLGIIKQLEGVDPEILNRPVNEAFFNSLQGALEDFMSGKKVNKAIQPALLNCVDMYASGKHIVLRAGDYISLQTHFSATATH